MTWWQPDKFADKKPYLEQRMKLIKAMRSFFDEQEFWEVQTPILQTSPCAEVHLHGFKTILKDTDLSVKSELYLHTSPELAMKKLLVAGLPKIYQICSVFRNAENSSRHSAEFTMLEWYRTHEGYETLMQDCMDLLRHCAEKIKIQKFLYQNAQSDPLKDWRILTVCEAFEIYAGINLQACLEDEVLFKEKTKMAGVRVSEDDGWDDLFFRLMGVKIEPFLGIHSPCILKDYPAHMAALSQKKKQDPRFAERFEVYVCGLELANAFGELTDAAEQRARYVAEMDLKEKLYYERYPIDEDFLRALEYGMPPSSGIALGVDRLAMLTSGAHDISQVLWTAKP